MTWPVIMVTGSWQIHLPPQRFCTTLNNFAMIFDFPLEIQGVGPRLRYRKGDTQCVLCYSALLSVSWRQGHLYGVRQEASMWDGVPTAAKSTIGVLRLWRRGESLQLRAGSARIMPVSDAPETLAAKHWLWGVFPEAKKYQSLGLGKWRVFNAS